MRDRSLTGPLVLIAIGAFFLLKNLIPDLHIMDFLRDWWPALLIVIGLIQLIERLARPTSAVR